MPTTAAGFESRREPSDAKRRAGRTAVPSSCCDAVPIRREPLQRRIKYDAILCSLLGGYEGVWLNNVQVLHTPATGSSEQIVKIASVRAYTDRIRVPP